MADPTNITPGESIFMQVALKMTREQLAQARSIVDEAMAGDSRAHDAGLLGAVLVALATNTATIRDNRNA